MKNIFILLFILLPFSLFAQDYQDAAGTSQMFADSITDYWNFMFTDIPNWFERLFAWLTIWAVKIKIYLYQSTIQFSWNVAKVIIEDLQIMSQITAQVSALPQDVRQALVDCRFFDALNIVIHAVMTRFVMGFK